MSVILQSTGGGQITLQEPATASNFTQTLPAADGVTMVSGNMPAFSAFNSVNQTVNHNTVTKVSFNTEEFDTNNNFASSTFTPTVAGYYQINIKVPFAGTATRNYYFSSLLYKNGSNISVSNASIFSLGSAGEFSIEQSKLVYMNGTTDYLEIYAYVVDYTLSASVSVLGNSTYASFSGTLVRAA